jgi:hypothetical protein
LSGTEYQPSSLNSFYGYWQDSYIHMTVFDSPGDVLKAKNRVSTESENPKKIIVGGPTGL